MEAAHRAALDRVAALSKVPAPESEPYKHWYEARDVLSAHHAWLLAAAAEAKLVAQAESRLGGIALEVEEPHVAEKWLERALVVLAPGCEDDVANGDPETLASVVDARRGGLEALTLAAVLWDRRDQTQRARVLLETAERADDGLDEECTTTIAFYLAQVFGRLELREKSAEYCRRTLERRRDAPDWVKNALGLSAYYVSTGELGEGLSLARDALSVATDRLDRNEEVSQDALADAHIHVAKALAESVRVSTTYPRDDFTASRVHFEAAKRRYVLNGFVTEHVGICRDESQLWASMETKDTDTKRRIAICRRRAALLAPLCSALNPRVYADLRCALAFELGDIWARALDLKEHRLEPAASLPRLRTCRRFRDDAVVAYDDFVACCSLSRRDHDQPTQPTHLDKDDLGPFLRAQLYAARLSSQLFGETGEDAVRRTARALERFTKTASDARAIVAHFDHLPPTFFRDELKFCDEMIALLPTKINQTHHVNQ